MFLLIKLAYRNIFRNFRRSLLSFLTITISIGLSILVIGLSIGMERQSVRLSVETRTGHVKMYRHGYIEEELTLPLDYTIPNHEALIEEMGTIPGVNSAAERILFPATLTDGVDELRLTGAGIYLVREDDCFHLSDKLIEGNYLENGEEKILLGDIVANLFNVSVGDLLTIIARTKYDAITALDVEIAGIFHVSNPVVDNNYFYLPLGITQTILEMENEVTEITVFGNDMSEADALAASLTEGFDTDFFEIVTWKYMSRDLLRLYEIRFRSRLIMFAILFIMSFASIMNTMLMSIFERIREIGMLMALGFRRRKVLMLFATEGIFLGIFGSFIGCLFGGGYTYYLKIKGWDLSSFGDAGFGDFPVSSVIYAHINPLMLLYFFLIGVSIAFLSALYPSLKGARLEPTEALRSV